MMLPCGILDGKCQQEWIWAHPVKWILFIAAVNIVGMLVGSWLKGRRERKDWREGR